MTPLLVAAAAAPILLILVLMLALQWSAARAGFVALMLAAGLAYTLFGFGGSPPGVDAAAAYTGVAAEGGFLTLTILWILWPALALHRLQQDSGAIETLRAGLARLSSKPALQALLVGWLLALFFEGAAGFGTPVALAAPILVGLGFAPVQTVVLALLGHAAGVSFGALGTPVLAQVALTGLDAVEIAWRTALLHTLLGAVLMTFFVRTLAANGHAPGPGWAALAAAGFLLPSLALAALVGPELATLGGALIGGGLFVAALRWRGGGARVPGLARALAPYAVLVALVVATRALPAVAQALGSVDIEWQLFDRYQGRMQPLVHPGTLLTLALLLGATWQRVPLSAVGPQRLHTQRDSSCP